MDIWNVILDQTMEDLRTRSKPSIIARVRRIEDWSEYLGSYDPDRGGPAVVCDLKRCFSFGLHTSWVARISLLIYVDGELLSAGLILRQQGQRIRSNVRFFQVISNRDCFRQLADWLRDTIYLDVPALREDRVE